MGQAGIVVVGVRDAIPALDEDRERAALDPDVGHDPVPAPRQRLGLAVRLVVDAELDERHIEPEQPDVRPEGEKDLGFVVRLAEGRAVVEIVELPEGPLRIRGPQADVLAEDVAPETGLEAQLENDLGLDERLGRVDLLQGRRIGSVVVGEHEPVVRSVEGDARLVGPRLTVELPELGEVGGLGRRDGGRAGSSRLALRRGRERAGEDSDEREKNDGTHRGGTNGE